MTLSSTAISDSVPGWRLLFNGLETGVKAENFPAAVEFVDRVAAIAERRQHHPDIDIRYDFVHLKLVSHDVGRLTERDVELAQEISGLITELGLSVELNSVPRIEVAIDAMDIPKILPFWEAILGCPRSSDDEITDEKGVMPSFWFQQMDEPRDTRSTFHIDVAVPHDDATRRVQAAVDAGGVLLSDEAAPAFWVLADPEGNEACVCTWQGRKDS